MSKNAKLLNMFTAYCVANPDQRFWQALCNWSEYTILAELRRPNGHTFDTFNLEDNYKEWPR